MVDADRAATGGQPGGEDVDVGTSLLPPIGNRGSYRPMFNPAPPEADKFQKAMDKIMAERAAEAQPVSHENAASHVIARGENQMASKHGISKVGKSVVEKFEVARHNTAIMSAMGHRGLERLVAKEEEEKRKRKARIKEITEKRSLAAMGRGTLLASRDGNGSGVLPEALAASAAELPNVYAALGQSVPPSRGGPPASPGSAAQHAQHGGQPPQEAQQQGSTEQHGGQQQEAQQGTGQLPPAIGSPPGVGGGGDRAVPPAVGGSSLQRQGVGVISGVKGRSSPATSPRAVTTRSAPGSLRPLRMSGGGEWDPQSPALRGAGAGRRSGKESGRRRRRSQPAHPKKAAASGESIVRSTSRVGRVLAEFGGETDWCSVTVMRHSLATILQANIRGWLVRRKWLDNPEAVVDACKAALQAERTEAERRIALKAELERRSMPQRQKEKVANVLHMLFPQKSMVGAALTSVHGGAGLRNGSGDGFSSVARAKWGRLNKNIDLAKDMEDNMNSTGPVIDESDSDMSDLGLEEMALIKMRARTPPWQKAEQSQWEGQWAKLNQKATRGNLDVVWDLADTASRVQAVHQRRAERAALQAITGGTLGSLGSAPYDPATQPLPSNVVTDLLVHRYIDKYTRLGLLDHLPLRTAAEAAMAARQQAAAVAAAEQQLVAHQQQQVVQQQHLQAAMMQHQQAQQQQAQAVGTGGR